MCCHILIFDMVVVCGCGEVNFGAARWAFWWPRRQEFVKLMFYLVFPVACGESKEEYAILGNGIYI